MYVDNIDVYLPGIMYVSSYRSIKCYFYLENFIFDGIYVLIHIKYLRAKKVLL